MFMPEDIYERTRRQPFLPFRILTTTGKSYDILHPDMAFTMQRGVIVAVPNEGKIAPDRQTEVAMIHIAELEDLPQGLPAVALDES